MHERTLAIIKPDAVSSRYSGEILRRIEESELRLIAVKMITLSGDDAGGFYAVHKERPFFRELVNFMSSGPIVVAF